MVSGLTKLDFFNRLRLVLRENAENRFLSHPLSLGEITEVYEKEPFGRGVYALCPIRAGTPLGVYPGNRLSVADFVDKEDFVDRSVRYAYYISQQFVLDPTDPFGYLPDRPELRLALINEPPCGQRINVTPVSSSRFVWYLTVCNIETGSQLFTNYGSHYKRNYPTEMSTTKGVIDWNEEELNVLRSAARSYSWLRDGIGELICASSAESQGGES